MSDRVVINLATGLEDAERVRVAHLVGHAATAAGRPTAMFLTKDAVRLALPGEAAGEPCAGCPPIERIFAQYAEGGGELLVCPRARMPTRAPLLLSVSVTWPITAIWPVTITASPTSPYGPGTAQSRWGKAIRARRNSWRCVIIRM